MDLKPGSIVFEDFEILEKIGSGGMGAVYKARQISLERIMVLKVLAQQSSNESRAIMRFQNEAKALSRLNHPGIAKVFDFGVHDGQPFLAMEFVDGTGLDNYIGQLNEASGKGEKPEELLPLSCLLQIFVELLDALNHAHNEGVIHRDIKPSNVLLVKMEDGSLAPVLLDFGVAKYCDDTAGDAQKLTAPGSMIGSPLYMSPEQCTGTNVSFLSDQYSLGCVFYEMLTGVPPFVGDTILDTISKHLNEDAPDLSSELYENLPDELPAIVGKMLAKEPEQRFQSLIEVLDEMLDVLEREQGVDTRPDEEVDLQRNQAGFAALKKIVPLSLMVLIAVAATWLVVSKPVTKSEPEKPEEKKSDVELVVEPWIKSNSNVFDLKRSYLMKDDDLKPFDNYKAARFVFLSDSLITDEGLTHFRNSPLIQLGLKETKVTTLKTIGPFKDSLRRLELGGTDITDEALLNLSGFSKLKEITLDATSITDAGLKNLRPVRLLGAFDLSGTQISDRGLDYLNDDAVFELKLDSTPNVKTLHRVPDFEYLTRLSLAKKTSVTDESLDKLNSLRNLRHLCLNHTAITDAGLKKLEKLRSLDELNLKDTRVTNKAALDLSRRMPFTRIDLLDTKSQLATTFLDAVTLLRKKNLKKARALFKNCVDTICGAQGPDAPQAVVPRAYLAHCSEALGEKAEATRLCNENVESARRSGNLRALVVALDKRGHNRWIVEGDPAGAVKYRLEALDIARKDPASLDQETRDIMYSIAIGYRIIGKYDEAKELLAECMALDKDTKYFNYACDTFELGFNELLLNHQEEADRLLNQADVMMGMPKQDTARMYSDLHSTMALNFERKGNFNAAIMQATLARNAAAKFGCPDKHRVCSEQVDNLKRLAGERAQRADPNTSE